MAHDEAEAAPSALLRTAFGQFAPGVSGNPGGRPSYPVELRDACREATAEAVAVLRELLSSKREPGSVRLRAARELLDRGYGPPAPTAPDPPAPPVIEGVAIDVEAAAAARRVVELVEAAYVLGVVELPREGAAWRRIDDFRQLRQWARDGALTEAELRALELTRPGALLPWGWKPGLVRRD
ncbi:MAG: hypothetical protein J0H14_02075 [Alphaproteobacteria bacterium]|nr:hypothetical protein [Alphaproteobacteria bacterium]